MMKPTQLAPWLCSLCVAAGAIALSGCSKEDLDLGDIDGLIGTEVDFALPAVNSTHNITLDEVINLDGNDAIETDANGNYLFAQQAGADKVSPARPKIDPVTISVQSVKNLPVDVTQLNNLFAEVKGLGATQAAIDAAVDALQFPLRATDKINIYDLHATHEPDIVSLTEVDVATLDGKPTVTMALTFSPDLAAVVSQFDRLTVSLPDYTGFTAVYNNQQLTPQNGRITLTNVPATGATLQLTFNSLTQFNAHSESDDNYLIFTPTDIRVRGYVNIEVEVNKASIRTDALKNQLAAASTTNRQYSVNGQTTIRDVQITEVRGEFNPAYDLNDGFGRVEINSLPDFLDDDDVRLILDNPVLTCDISSDIDVEAEINNPALVAHYDKTGETLRIPLPAFDVKRHSAATGATTTRIVISDKPVGDACDVALQPLGGARLAQIIERIPDYITFDCTAGVKRGTTGHLILNKAYTVQPSFDIKAPLAFNEGTVIVYRDSIEGWKEDLEDLTLAAGAEVTLTAEVESQVPVALHVTATPIGLSDNGRHYDLTNNEYTVEVTTDQANNDIAAGTPGNIATSQLTLRIAVNNADAIRQLDGLRFNAKAFTPADKQGFTLNKETMTLRLNKIGIRLKGTVEYNTDD